MAKEEPIQERIARIFSGCQGDRVYFDASLFDCTRPREGYLDEHVEIVKSHIDAMNAVVEGRVRGGGGEVGEELKATLAQVIEKYSNLE